MAEVLMRDQSRAGHVLGGATVSGLPDRARLGHVLEVRIRAEVDAYNRDPGPTFRGLVAPEDAVRHSDGLHMATPRPLDADRFLQTLDEAVTAGVVRFEVDGVVTDDLDHDVDCAAVDEVVVVMDRPMIARRP